MQEVTGELKNRIIQTYNEGVVKPKLEQKRLEPEDKKVPKKKKRKSPLFRNNFMPAPKGFTKPEERNEFGTLKKEFGMTTKWGNR